ncbi:MAG TPA: pentapeptide repeat-containing protein [Candidatus Methanoperedens sp.]|nr:pentapeptide repeat-containing protein [Candidatus Methanoperedens sp.]HLB69908.1 pentapeptide repeat-containing protein [Candidatus Methanoperedens sp.]
MKEISGTNQTLETNVVNQNKDNISEGRETSLNFEAYADALSESILSKDNDKALVIGIFGKWGSGKTTLMKTIEKKIIFERNHDFKTIWFNAWKFDKEGAVRRALMMRVLEELKIGFVWGDIPEKDGERFKEYVRQKFYIDWVLNADISVKEETIKFSSNSNSFILKRNKKKNEAILTIGKKSEEFVLIQDNNIWKIYEKDLYTDLDKLQTSLYQEINREELGSYFIDWGKAAKGTFKLVLKALPVIGKGLAELIEKGSDVNEDLFDAIQRQKKIINVKKVQFLEEFQKSFETLINTHFIKKDKSVVIFIDDLDRCLPEKALDVLEAIKLFMDVKGCIFILGIDKDVINYIIYKKYKDLYDIEDGRGNENRDGKGKAAVAGENYLEKIIQLSFNLPTIKDEDMVKFIYGLNIDKEFYDPYIRMITKGIEPNPRKIKRLFKLVDLLRNLTRALENEEKNKLSGSEKIIYEAIMIEWAIISSNHPNFWQAVSHKPSILLDMHQYHMNKETIKNQKKIDEEAGNNIKKIDDDIKVFLDDKRYDRLNDLINQFYFSLKYNPKLSNEKDIETIISESLENIIERVIHLSNVAGIEKSISSDEKGIEEEGMKTEKPKESEKPLGREGADKSMDEKKNFIGADLEGRNFEGIDWKGMKLNGANLKHAKLTGAHLEKANLTESILEHAIMTDAHLNQAKMVRAKLDSAILNKADLTGAKLNHAKLWHAELRGAILNNVLLRDAELYSADLSDSNFTGADLYNAGLMGANMKGTKLNGANLRQVNLKGAIFDGETDFTGADIDSITIDNLGGSNWEVAKWDPDVRKQIIKKYGERST